jgi:hypothetical protein
MSAPELTDDVHETIVEYLRAGNFIETASAAAGVSVRTVRNWLRLGADVDSEYATFRREALAAIAEAEHTAVAFLRAAAEGGDTKAATWWLERRHPARWGLKIRHVVEEQLSAAVERIERLEGEIGREAVERVLDALAGDPGGPEAEIEAQADLH